MNLSFDTTRHTYAFHPHDRVTINGSEYLPVSHNEVGWLFAFADGTGACQQFTHKELSNLGARKQLRVERRYFGAEAAQRRLSRPDTAISLLSEKQQFFLCQRKAWVEAFLEKERLGEVNRTDDAIRANMGDMTLYVFNLVKQQLGQRATHASGDIVLKKPPSTRTLRGWLVSYERNGLVGLVQRTEARGNRASRWHPDEVEILMREVRGYMHPDRPTIDVIVKKVNAAFVRRNAELEAEGSPPLKCPGRGAVRHAIRNLEPFLVEIRRNGAAAARIKFAPVGKGLEVTRPLERVEMDEWDIDLITLLAQAGVLARLSEEERIAVGLSGENTIRWKLTVAMCARTRCILGMVLTPTATSNAAIQALKMVLSDKGQLSTVVKTHGAWHMHGVPETMVTDCGPAFTSNAFQIACADVGIDMLRPEAGIAELRGRIERFFGTMGSSLMSELSGRTFSDIVAKGDANPEDRACLTENDLADILVRWVVDVYHNTEHEGLDGETPAECWERLAAKYGVTPPPDVQRSRQIFGQRVLRKVGKKGVRVLGVHYHSPVLANYFLHCPEREVELRWLPSDIGAIEINLDKTWHTLPAVMDGLDGTSAQLWMAAVREVRAADPDRKKHNEKVMLDAMNEIRARSHDAQAAMGLLSEDWSEERVRREEAKLMIGFEAGPVPASKPRKGGIGQSLLSDQDDSSAKAAPVSAPKGRRKGDSKFKMGDRE